MTRIENGKAGLITRGGHDWSAKMPALVQRARAARHPVGLARRRDRRARRAGTAELQRAAEGLRQPAPPTRRSSTSSSTCPSSRATTCATSRSARRRQLLKALLEEKGTEHVRFSADFEADPASILSSACRMNLEGVIAKRADAPYTSRRTETWLKLKCKQRQEFVVVRLHRPQRRVAPDRQPAARRACVRTANSCRSAASAPAGIRRRQRALKRKLLEARETRSHPSRPVRPSPGAGRGARPAASAGSSHGWWPRWRSPSGRRTARSGTPPSSRCAPTSPRRPSCARPPSTVGGSGRCRSAGKAAVGGIKVSNAERVIDPARA